MTSTEYRHQLRQMGLSVPKLAALLGVTPQTVYHHIRQDSGVPSIYVYALLGVWASRRPSIEDPPGAPSE